MNMKRFLVLAVLVLAGITAASGQKLVIGEKAPDLSVSEWMPSQPDLAGKARLIDFYHGLNKDCQAQLTKLNSLASQHSGSMVVMIVSKDGKNAANKPGGLDKNYYTAYDSGGKTFNAYGIQYVPFSVLLDTRGKVVWFGNISTLDNATIDKAKK